ncbi:MAG: sensor domain-containing diguanylate cyclase [Candidatus Brocadia sp.]|nr:diguanylate cyclase [Candidatus Brocadia sp. AMX3]MDG5996439.1 GGDEF domain-containing protein [Candidatus Brocadia sp.]RIJ96802.1 MAG: sensor domain-containing diguanylate cyclase [Candidatus Brocadia sp.]
MAMIAESDIHKNLLDSLSGGICAINRDRVITYWNKNTTTLTGYMHSETVGKCCRDDILMYVDEQGKGVCENECMALGAMADGAPRSMEVYAHHKDGYRVPVLVRILPLKNLEGQVIGAIEELHDNSSKAEYVHKTEELEKRALLDPQTGLMKRRGLEMNLRTMFSVMQRYGWSYGIFLVDIDGLKRINDLHGPKTGDAVVKMVTKTLLNSVRASDMVGRWGGDEFMVIAMNVTENHLRIIANKIHALIEQSGFFVGIDAIRVTVSVSGTVAQSSDTVDALLKRLNHLMSQGKSSGKNCISV